MKLISSIFLVFNLFFAESYNYLNNDKVNYDVKQMDLDHPWDQGKSTSGYHIGFPRGGIGCITSKNDNDEIYLISSQALLSRWNEYYRCSEQYRTVSIFKRNLTSSKNEKELIIGEEYTGSYNYQCYFWNDYDLTLFDHLTSHEKYNKERELCINKGHFWRDDMTPKPNGCYCGCCKNINRPVGGKGSDNVVTCGIDKQYNILYYIGANYHKCGSYYNTKPSLVRINLTSFQFMDRTILNEIEDTNNLTKWQDNELLEQERYFNFPGTSHIYNGKIYLSFRITNNGIWVIDIRNHKIKIIQAYQVLEPYNHIEFNGTQEIKTTKYEILSSISRSYFNEKDKIIYFVAETYTDNAKILILNVSNNNIFNDIKIIELNGINNVKGIKMDTKREKIYLLVGQVSSEMYKMDKQFNVIPVSQECEVDSLTFPIEWKSAESFEIDEISGYIYVFFIKKPYNGFSTIRINDFTLNHTFNKFIFYNKDDELWEPEYLNISYINRKSGKIFISNFPNENNFFLSFSEISILGCSYGRRKDMNDCINCIPGTYSNKIGTNTCKLCNFGYSSSDYESSNCNLCTKGKYANLLGSSNCESCGPGNYSENTGSKICKNCEAGKYNSKTGSLTPTDCLECQNGKYSKNGFDSCLTCDLGKVTIDKKYCYDCLVGTYSINLDITSYDQCLKCPKGRYNNNIGSKSINDCIVCEVGTYSLIFGGSSKDSCLNCPAGMYRSLNMNSGEKCNICQNGKYSSDKAEECIDCSKGKYNNGLEKEDHLTCLNCLIGKYSNILGADSELKCINCQVGKYSIILGSNTSNNCLKCEKGKYSDIIGSDSKENCKQCPGGKFRKFKGGMSINDCINCPVGFYSYQNTISCEACAKGKYSINPGSFECTNCEEGEFTNENSTISCNLCPENSKPNHDFTRCECITGTYMENNEPLICSMCPPNFICEKKSTIETLKVKPKFWRANKTTLYLEKCKKGYNCPGGEINNTSDDLCNVGHIGPICDVCKEGWAKNDGKCFECLTTTGIKVRSYIFTFIFPIIIACITFFMIKTANPSTSETQKEPLSGVIKIFMNYAQIFTLASSFEINWPEMVLILFDRTKEFSSPKISFYSSDCTIGWDYYNKLLIYIVLPILYVILVFSILYIYTFYFYDKKRNKKIKDEDFNDDEKFYKKNPNPKIFFQSWLCTATLIGLFLAWPTIIKQSLSIIPCKKFGTQYYLLEDLSIECYTTKHFTYSVLCYISLVVYGIIVPFIAYNLIREKRFSLYDFESKYEMPAPLSFLFLGYREEVWYYEFIVMAKKYSLILITVFLKEYSRYQMICASLFIQAAFFIHVFLRPYDSISNYGVLCNKLESISLLALVVTLNSGLFFGTINDQYQLGSFEYVLITLLFLMNALVMIYFLYYLIKLSVNESMGYLKKFYKKLEDRKFFCLKYISNEKRKIIKEWSEVDKIDTYGINLKSPEEIELFNHFFNDKKMFSHELKEILKNEDLNKLGFILNKIRSQIEIIEKQRCWLSVQNNRLYKKLRKELVDNKNKLSKENINKLNDILENYINNGLKYSKTIDNISEKALKSIRRKSIIEMQTITENNESILTNYSSTDSYQTSDEESSYYENSLSIVKEITI